MTAPIEPARRSAGPRRPKRTAADLVDDIEGKGEAEAAALPVPVSRAKTIPPRTPVASGAQIEAQMIGERRGLRAGASAIDAAKASYNRTEWSGSKDRRAPKGRAAKTDV